MRFHFSLFFNRFNICYSTIQRTKKQRFNLHSVKLSWYILYIYIYPSSATVSRESSWENRKRRTRKHPETIRKSGRRVTLPRQVEENRITPQGAKWWTLFATGKKGREGKRGEKAVGNGQCEGRRRRRGTLSRMRNNTNLNGSHDSHLLYERRNKTKETGGRGDGKGGWFLSMAIEIVELARIFLRGIIQDFVT